MEKSKCIIVKMYQDELKNQTQKLTQNLNLKKKIVALFERLSTVN